MTCANCRGSHYATLVIYPAKKQAISLARSRRDECKMLDLERIQRKLEVEEAERAKEAEKRIQVAATAEAEHDAERLFTIDGDDGDLKKRN